MHLAFLPNQDHEGATGGGARWLSAAAARGNPFHERTLVEAAARHLAGPGERLHLLRTGAAPWEPVLPLRHCAETPAGSIWAVWSHVHALDTTPGGDGDFPALLNILFDFLRERRARVLRWATLPADTPFFEILVDWLEDNGLEHRVTKQVLRPVLRADAPEGAALPATYLDGKRLREFRRSRRRLEELGTLRLKTFRGPHDAGRWLASFLEIERSGWKGAAGTAIDCRPGERAWFGQVMHRAAAEGRALIYALELAGRPIAMSVNLRAGTHVWCFKTAYREELARFSPGALMEYESTLAALDDPTVAWLDACTADDRGLMGALWRDRRPVVDLLIAPSRASNGLVRTSAYGWRLYLAAKRRAASLRARGKNKGQA